MDSSLSILFQQSLLTKFTSALSPLRERSGSPGAESCTSRASTPSLLQIDSPAKGATTAPPLHKTPLKKAR